MRFWSLSFLLLCSYQIVYGQYKYSDVQGIWELKFFVTETDCEIVYENRFLVFRRDYFIYIPTIQADCSTSNEFGVFRYGFTNELYWHRIDSLRSNGSNLAYIDTDGDYDLWSWFSISDDGYMEFYNKGYLHVPKLPSKPQRVLYNRSLHDHRNYAREFLEYDICGIKADSVQLLDSLRNPTNTIIYKDDIVVVRDATGDLLQVEYEPEPDKYVVGYLRKDDLQFVCSE